MKQVFKRILSFSLSIIIIVISLFFSSMSIYAFSPEDFIGNTVWEKMTTAEKWNMVFSFYFAETKALFNGNLSEFLEGQTAINDYINAHDPDELASETGLTIPADLAALIKQALIEYAEETNPFFLANTYRARDIPASTFPTKKIYNTFLAYATSHNLTAFETYIGNSRTGYLRLGDVTPLLKEGGGFVSKNTRYFTCNPVNGDWSYENILYDNYTIGFTADSPTEQVITNVEEGKAYFTSYEYFDFNKTSFHSNGYGASSLLVSPDGGRIRVFKSLTEFMDYDAGQRKVYFGSGFYDFDPTDITATWDEINDKIDRMDDILQDILDAITDSPNLSEEDLEKLIDELIGKIGEIGGELGDKTDQTNTILGGISSTLGGIASSLSGYFSSVLDYLDQILEAIKALVWIEADDKLDDDKSDLLDLIDKIWKDPETGSQEAADTLSGSFAEIASGITKKFPFSIPWDIYSLFTVFSGTAPPDTATYRTVTLGVQPFTVDDEDLEQDIHEAPYFKLPLRIDSFRIYEEVVLDLKDFKPVSKLSRGLLSVLFAVFLIKFTMRIIDLFRGGTDD